MKAPRLPRRISIYVLLSLLIVVLSVPALVFFGRFIVETAAERRSEALTRGLIVADQVADALGREFQSLSTMLAVFATSGWIEEEDYARLHLRARSALAGTGTHFIVLDENLDQILNTRLEYGLELGQTGDPETPRRAIETGQSIVSDVFVGRIADTPVFNMLRPVRSNQGRARVLIVTRDAESLSNLVDPSLLPDGWNYAILDGSGHVAFRSRAGEATTPQPENCVATGAGPSDDYLEETSAFVVVQRLVAWPWRVCAWASDEVAQASELDSWQFFRGAALLVVLLSFATAAVLGRLIVGAIARAARLGRALEAGAEIEVASSSVAEVDEVLRILYRAARERAAREEELRLLLKETAHRAKNQIAVASSLVRLAARSAPDVDRLRDDLLSRLVALARSVDMIVGRDWQTVSMSQLLSAQLKPFIDGEPDRLELSGEELAIAPTAAQTLGLVINELATNAAKYGAWSNADGKVTVEWTTAENSLFLSWTETGGPPVTRPSVHGFGTELIDTLVGRSFGGEVSRAFDESGFAGRLRLPLDVVQVASPTPG